MRQVSVAPRPPRIGPTEGFSERLALAIGFYGARPKEAERKDSIRSVESIPYEGGRLEKLALYFDRPRTRLTALFATGEGKRKGVWIVLHGLASSADRTMGVAKSDYMLEAGRWYFRKGYDVLAVDLTGSPVLATWRNAAWQTQATGVYGVHTRGVCEFVRQLDLRRRYRKVFVHGFSNGGIVAQYVAVLCQPLDLAVSGDIVSEPFESYDETEKRLRNLKWGAYLDWLSPVFAREGLASLIEAAKTPLLFSAYESNIETLAPKLLPSYSVVRGFRPDGAAYFLNKSISRHVPELEGVLAFSSGRFEDIDGWTLSAGEVAQ